jgi:hypothetical protein
MFFARFEVNANDLLDAEESQKLLSDVTLNNYESHPLDSDHSHIRKHSKLAKALPEPKDSPELTKAENLT